MVGGRFYSSHFSQRQTLKVFSQKLVAVKIFKVKRILYIALHDSEQVEVGGVTGLLEFSCNSFFQFCGIEERML